MPKFTPRVFTPLLFLAVSLILLGQNGQTTFPGTPDTDANLGVAVDRFTARISGHITSTATTWTLRNLSKPLVNNMFLSAGNEIVMVTSVPQSDQVVVTRHVCGTSAVDHYDGETVGAVWNSCMHNVLRTAVKALEAAATPVTSGTSILKGNGGGGFANASAGTDYQAPVTGGPCSAGQHVSNINATTGAVTCSADSGGGVGGGSSSPDPFPSSADFDFTPQSPGGSLAVGGNTITLTPVPKGVNGTNANYYVYISGGTGTAEACQVAGGTAVSGAGSGTLTFVCGNTHTGAWTISSSTAGIQEALQYGGAWASVAVPTGTHLIYAPIDIPFSGATIVGAGGTSTILQAADGSNLRSIIRAGNSNLTVKNLRLEGNFINQTPAVALGMGIILEASTYHHLIQGVVFQHFGLGAPTSNPFPYYGVGLYIDRSTDIEVADCRFYSNWGADIQFANADSTGRTYKGYFFHDNIFGSPNVVDAQTNINYWDTYSGAPYSILSNGYSQMTVVNNKFYGNIKKFGLGNPVLIANCHNCNLSDNTIEGMGNGTGTITVTNGNGVITGVNTFFNTGGAPGNDVGAFLQVEGDPTTYQITVVTSATQITVTPVIARAGGSGLKYRMSSTGDAIACNGCINATLVGNVVRHSHDNGMDISSDEFFGTNNIGYGYVVSGNTLSDNQDSGLYVGGVKNATVVGNTIMNNGQVGSAFIAAWRPGITIMNDSATHIVANSIFQGNTLGDNQAVPTQQYGIAVDGTTGTGNILGVNNYTGNVLGPVYTSSASVLPTVFLPADYTSLTNSPRVSPMWVFGPSTTPDVDPGTFGVMGGDTNHLIKMGFNSANGYGWLQGVITGSGYTPLWLNPVGSPVIIGKPIPVGSLPACSAGLEGGIVPVTDANSTTFNAAIAAGGANHVRAYCNGTSWVVR